MMLVALILAGATPAATPVCPPETPRLVAGKDGARARPLTSEPAARQYLAVRHTENGCARPQLVSAPRRRR